MSSVVDSFPPPNGFPRKYPWEQWTDGQIHLLKRGEDFEGRGDKLVHAARVHAERRGMRVTAAVRGAFVYLQFGPVSPGNRPDSRSHLRRSLNA